jgi:lipoate---protein ligase
MFFIHHRDTHDPALNLAMEEYCFRRFEPGQEYLLFYVNSPSVIVGRHQDALAEVDPAYVRKNDISLLRRLSGGGAVYHDTGNLNFSLITDFDDEKLLKMKILMRPMVETLRQLGVPVRQTEKNDLFVGKKKISGAAQFTNTRRLLSHGTLLVEADLHALRSALSPDGVQAAPHAVRSVPSPVANVSDFLKISMGISGLKVKFLECIKQAARHWGEITLPQEAWSEINTLATDKYRAKSWNFGFKKQVCVAGSRRADL